MQRILGERYALEEELGRGGMGVVFRARDLHLQRAVAVKIAHPKPGARARLRREAAVLGALRLTGVPALLDAGEDGDPFLVLPLLSGQPLSALLKQGPQPQLAPALASAARTLAAAHATGIVHRDLKPDNLLVDDSGAVWVLDWGLARLLPDTPAAALDASDPWPGDPAQTAEGALLGTPAYMSPEQITAASAGPAADVWALGVILWELLSGQPAYPGSRRSAVLSRILAGPPPVREPDGPLPRLIVDCTRPADARPTMDAVAQALLHPPAPPVLPRRLLAAAAGGLALAGIALALRSPPPAPSDPSLYVTAAQSAWRLGDIALAEQLAIQGLRAGADRSARGLLLRATERPTLTTQQDGLRCGIGEDLSFDGSIIICAQTDMTVAWQITPEGAVELWRQDLEVHLIKVIGDERLLVQAGEGSGAFLLDLHTGAPLSPTIPELRRSGRLSNSRHPDRFWGQGPSGWYTATLIDGSLSVVPIPPPPCSGQLTVDFAGREMVGCADGLVRLEDGAWQPIAERPDDLSRFVRWMWNGPLYVAASEDHTLSTVDPRTGQFTPAVDRLTGTNATGVWMASQSHGHRIYVGQVGQARGLWQPISLHSAHRRITDAGELVTVSRGQLQVWRLPVDSHPRAWHAEGPVKSMVWTEAGLIAHRKDGKLQVWQGKEVVLSAEGVRTFAHHDGVIALAQGAHLRRWDVSSGLQALAEQSCQVLAWLGDDLVCGPPGPGPVLIDGETGAINASPLLPDSAWFAASSNGEQAILMEWSARLFRMGADQPRLEPLHRDGEARSISLSPDGRWLAVGQRYRLKLTSLQDSETRMLARGDHLNTPHAWSADGTRIAVVDLDGYTRIWAAETGTLLAAIPPTAEGATAVAFSPDGRHLARADPFGLIVALDLAPLEDDLDTLEQAITQAWGALP